MAKGKSLLSQTSKPKKVTKYDETSKHKLEYKHSIGDQVIYLGLIDEYRNTVATIVKRSKKHISEYYSIKFSIDDEILNDIAGGVLQNLEEYELEQENKEEQDIVIQEYKQNNMSEYELELNKQGIESYHNYVQCLSPIVFYEHKCDKCGYEKRCVYSDKYKYKKFI